MSTSSDIPMANPSQAEIDVAVITDISDISTAFDIVWACFGERTPDAIFQAFSPRWDTPNGYAHAVQRMAKSFENATNRDKHDEPTQIFLKATIADTTSHRRIVGFAIWIELSVVQGYGEPPLLNAREGSDAEELYPDNVSEQKHCCTLFENLYRQRHELMERQSSASPPAIMALDLCAVHPEFQRQGIASKLVQYGLDEAERRGGLICCTEATRMAIPVYKKLGFSQQGLQIEFNVDDAEFASNGMPLYVFMRTKQGRE